MEIVEPAVSSSVTASISSTIESRQRTMPDLGRAWYVISVTRAHREWSKDDHSAFASPVL